MGKFIGVKNLFFYWLLFSFFLILGDQVLKFWVKTSFYLKESLPITSWFELYFVENNGFAFGIQWFGVKGKILLTFLRFVLAGFVLYYITRLIRGGAKWLLVLPFVLIFSGATGNLIDSVFYGVFFSESSPGKLAVLWGDGGYAPLFFGQVVDMFYFPIAQGHYPDWVPFWGGKKWVFFQFVFNLADSYITIGAFLLFLINPFKSVSTKKQ